MSFPFTMTKMCSSSPQSIPPRPLSLVQSRVHLGRGQGGFLPHAELKVLRCSPLPGQGRALSGAGEKASRSGPGPSDAARPDGASLVLARFVLQASCRQPQRVMLEKNWPSEFL